MDPENFYELIDSETDSFDSSNDSENDPSFDIEETRSKLSALSIKKKPKSRVAVEVDEDADLAEVAAPEFDADDQKSYEVVQKMIECGQVEKLKVEQCDACTGDVVMFEQNVYEM
nr:hypothetical protein [Tanacetum cinerariifolium]